MAENILKLKVDSTSYDQKIKRAKDGLLAMEAACRKVGGTFEVVEKEDLEFVKALGKMETTSRSLKGKIGELSAAFTDLSSMFNRLSDKEKQSPWGKDLAKSLEQLKVRIHDSSKELKDINKELGGPGGFNSMLEQLGGKLGINSDLMGMVTGGTLAYTAAIGAAAVAVEKAAEAWAKYNSEIAKQDQITTVTTGLKGADAEAMTDQVRAIAATYNVEFRDAINAANTLMTQFGASGQEAINLIKDGMQGMIAGDGPKLLQMIQQYAPAFRDAGIEASQLIAIIHNTEGGIFTDQNMNAIVMGIKNIRMMKDTTKEAMKSIGIDADSMAKKLNDGTMSVFDALREVSGKIEEVGSGSQAAGEIMNDIFGKQGVTAGTNLGKAIETLNLNLDETKLQTDKVGSAMAELQTANEQLNTQIRKTFGYKGWEEMEIGLKVKLVNAVTNVMTAVEKVENAFNTCKSYYDKFESAVSQSKVASVMLSIYRAVENAVVPFKLIYEYVYKIFDALGQTPNVKVPRVSGGGTPQGNTSRDNIGSSTGGGNTGGGGRSTTSKSKTPKLVDGFNLQQVQGLSMSDLITAGRGQTIHELQAYLKDVMYQINNTDDPETKWKLQADAKDLKDQIAHMEKDPLSLDFDPAKMAKDAKDQEDKEAKEKKGKKKDPVELASKAVSGISAIGNGLKGIGIDLGSGFDQMIGVMSSVLTIIEGVNAIISVIEALSSGRDTAYQATMIGEVTTANTLLATIAATNWVPFHSGGMVHAATGIVVPGSPNGGHDTVRALLSPGEVVLNAAQQNNLANELQGSGLGNLHLETEFAAEKIRVVLRNNDRRRNRGEYLTSKSH